MPDGSGKITVTIKIPPVENQKKRYNTIDTDSDGRSPFQVKHNPVIQGVTLQNREIPSPETARETFPSPRAGFGRLYS